MYIEISMFKKHLFIVNFKSSRQRRELIKVPQVVRMLQKNHFCFIQMLRCLRDGSTLYDIT